ncbi:MAG: HAD family hydrolase [Methylococcaceae bacterium]
MTLVLFDIGHTLIEDPFPEVIASLSSKTSPFLNELLGDTTSVDLFWDYWCQENWQHNFSFASHFVQEETWPVRALRRLEKTNGKDLSSKIPLIVPILIKEYREAAKDHIANQKQLVLHRHLIKSLRNRYVKVGVASNDREYASRAMLNWANLFSLLDYCFVSETLSETYISAEKPSPVFFQAIIKELRLKERTTPNVVYIGDSEANDITPAKSLGITTVRYLRKYYNMSSSWIDGNATSEADFTYSDPEALFDIFDAILRQ